MPFLIVHTNAKLKDNNPAQFVEAAAQLVASGDCDRGIVMCTTGVGISIAAHKVRGIRCALCSEP